MSVKSKFTAIADEIRTLSDSVNSMDLDDILSTLNEVNTEVANQTDLILQITEELNDKTMDPEEKFISARNFKIYENDTFETIGNGAFTYCLSLTSVSFPVCKTIGNSAFNGCSSLTSVSFPVCETIGSFAFTRCNRLSFANFPNCNTIKDNAFTGCLLTSVNFPNCIKISFGVFQNDPLTSISFPKCTNIGSYAFGGCTSLTSISFPVCTSIGHYAFQRCINLTSVNFPNCTRIENGVFASCYRLSQVYLTASSLCALSNSSAFDSTPFTGYSSYFSGTPYIYVPESLVTFYQNATNWAYFSSMIVPDY